MLKIKHRTSSNLISIQNYILAKYKDKEVFKYFKFKPISIFFIYDIIKKKNAGIEKNQIINIVNVMKAITSMT